MSHEDFLQDLLKDLSRAESKEVVQEIFRLLTRLDAKRSTRLSARSLSHVQTVWDTTDWSTDASQKSSRWTFYYENSRALFSRFLAVAKNPRRSAPIIIDCLLLIQSTWTGRQLGPDFVYPMLGIKKRQSGYLAKLILQHSRDHEFYELRVPRILQQDIHPLCVAVINLDQMPADVANTSYSAPADFYGIVCMMVLTEAIVALALHVLYGWDSMPLVNWGLCVCFVLFFCLDATFHGEGTLTLSRRSEAPVPGCVVLLDQDFTLILNGIQGVVEAITESNINLSYNSASGATLLIEELRQEWFCDILESSCEGIYLAVLMLCWFAVVSPTTLWAMVPPAVFLEIIAFLVPILQFSHRAPFDRQRWSIMKGISLRVLPLFYVVSGYVLHLGVHPALTFLWHFGVPVTYFFLRDVLSPGLKTRDYPISPAKLLDVLGRPHVRKWQFNTPAAAATFQCLILYHSIARPIGRHMDVLAFFDVLIPDETNVWRAWKRRVADRIVHEQDISFMPTIPTFRDDHQQEELVDLLHQAQSGYRAYKKLYGQDAPPDTRLTDDDSQSIISLLYSSL